MFGHDKHQDEEDQAVTDAPVADDADTTSDNTDAVSDEPESQAPADPQGMTLPEPEGKPASSGLTFEVTSAYEPVPEPKADGHLGAVEHEVSHGGPSGDLVNLRRNALHELSPLVGHLDQSPEEKYELAKMVYEETRDQSKLTALYEAARNLSDDKAKAAAIYDVIKKINELH